MQDFCHHDVREGLLPARGIPTEADCHYDADVCLCEVERNTYTVITRQTKPVMSGTSCRSRLTRQVGGDGPGARWHRAPREMSPADVSRRACDADEPLTCSPMTC